jgi:RNA polymerase sigma-70 factor (ECF subfamily)
MGSNSTLVDAALAGDETALLALWERHVPSLRRRVRRLLPSEEDTEDLLQDVLFHLVRHMGSIEHPEKIRAYLAQVAVRTSFNVVRKHVRRKRFLEEFRRVEQGSASLSARFVAADILSRLGADDRQLLAKRHLEGHTLGELSAWEGVSLATVKRRLRRATNNAERVLGTAPGSSCLHPATV